MRHALPIVTDEKPVVAGTNLPRKLRGKPFQLGPDPRRNLTKGGRPSDEFTASMRALASSDAVHAALAAILSDKNHEHFIRALTFCADRGFGRPTQPIDLTSNGESLADILRRGRERIARMRNAHDADGVH
jgi:hypothetical protein